jgi:hypothetical protein
MIKQTLSAELQKTSATVCMSPNNSKQSESFHRALEMSTDQKHAGKHRVDEPRSVEINENRWNGDSSESEGMDEKNLALTASKEPVPLDAITEPVSGLPVSLESTHRLFEVFCSLGTAGLNQASASNILSENRTPTLADENVLATPDASKSTSAAKASLTSLKRMANASTISNVNAEPVTKKPEPESELSVISERLVTPPIQQITPNGIPADTKPLPPAPFGQNFSSNAVLSAGEAPSETGGFKSYFHEVAEVLANTLQLTVRSKTLRLQIDVPDLGNISARFGSGADGVSVLLTSKDQDNLIAVSELQRDMRVWLDQANLEKPEGGELAGAMLETPSKSEKRQSDRNDENGGSAGGRTNFDLSSSSVHDEMAVATPVSAGQASRRWRHI